MKTKITNLSLVIAFIVSSIAVTQDANAQQTTVASPQGAQDQLYIQPIGPRVQPNQQNPFYFGMNVELKRTRWGATTLRIVSVTPGSPAQQAGLEIGDEIRRVNGRGFHHATDSYHAVRLLNQYVLGSSHPVPVAGGGGVASAIVLAPPRLSTIAQLVVRNVRNGQDVSLNVYPTRVGYGGGASAALSAGG